jgi:hypothetical protein
MKGDSMSAYSENKTVFRDASLLIEALTECGYQAGDIEVHAQPTNLYGYHNDKRDDTAEIIIRRDNVNARMSGGASNDIGFKRNADGTISAIISDYDSYKHNAQWLTKLKVAYAEKGLIRQGAKQGLRFAGKQLVGKKMQLFFTKA